VVQMVNMKDPVRRLHQTPQKRKTHTLKKQIFQKYIKQLRPDTGA